MVDFAPRRAPLMPLAGLAIVLIAAIGAFLVSHGMAVASREVNHSIEVRVGISELGRAIAAQNAGFRGYLLVGTREQFDEANGASAAVLRQYAALKGMTADEPSQRASLDAVGPMIADRMRFISERMNDRARGGTGLVEGAARVQARRLIVDLGDRLNRMSAEEQRLLELREARSQRLISWLSMALAGAVLLVVVVAYLTISDARERFFALRTATREARAAAAQAAAEAAAREEAEAQLRQIQKMESIGQLTGGIAHDFNNMLAVIVGSLDLARRRIDDPDKVSRHVANALEGAGRATTLVSRLLAFSRRQPLAPARLEINGFLNDVSDMLRRTLGEAVVVETRFATNIWSTFVDPVQLENALLNLAVNARDAMERGGTMTLSTANMSLHMTDAAARADLPPGDYIEISVGDTGAGMSEDVIARAFDPFFTTKSVGRGTGLGLSQVFGFVRQSGGHVTIESVPGSGACVRLLLPRYVGEAKPHASAGPPAASGPLAPGGGQRILLVEDDDRVRRFSAEALHELGYVALVASNGAHALRLLAAEPEVAMLFTDVVMPGMSGPELAVKIKAKRPDIKVLFATGYERDGGNAAAIAELNAPVLRKPFAVADLGQKIHEVLAG